MSLPPSARLRREEIVNSITHGIGVPLSLAALVLLWAESAEKNNWRLYALAATIYSITMLWTYLSSSLYHAFFKASERLRKRLHLLDHSAIYLFIAGTYTPVALFVLPSPWRESILAAVWLLALTGVIYKVFFLGRHQKLSLILYLLMGWLIILAIRPLLQNASTPFLWWMLAGGLSYSLGTVFFSLRKMPYAHGLWHLLVLGGSICHFVAIYRYLY